MSLARRHGHVQVTPLHAASAMLADTGGLLCVACLWSRVSSHPLQCKALKTKQRRGGAAREEEGGRWRRSRGVEGERESG
jgi:hypothetical protein